MDLTIGNVHNLFLYCCLDRTKSLIQNGKRIEPVCGRSVETKQYFVFSQEKICSCQLAIEKMLFQLPEQFMQSGKHKGYPVNYACFNKYWQQWADKYTADQLVCLGHAAKLLDFTIKEKYWHYLPESTPMIVIKDDYEQRIYDHVR